MLFQKVLIANTKKLPIVMPNDKSRIDSLINTIIKAYQKNPETDTTAEEQEIDRLVYHLYGLTYDEVKIIDPETPMTEEEYISE